MNLTMQLEQFRDFVAEHGGGNGSRTLHYLGDCDLVLREGAEFRSVPWTTWRGRGYRRGKARACYQNAHHLALHRDDLAYCEGFATTGLLPVHHGWCVDRDGRVVDPTWRDDDSRHPVAEWEYLGIPFEMDYVNEVTAAKGTYGVLDNYRIYDEPLPEGAVAVSFLPDLAIVGAAKEG